MDCCIKLMYTYDTLLVSQYTVAQKERIFFK